MKKKVSLEITINMLEKKIKRKLKEDQQHKNRGEKVIHSSNTNYYLTKILIQFKLELKEEFFSDLVPYP